MRDGRSPRKLRLVQSPTARTLLQSPDGASFSLRLGHARVLTTTRVVIHYALATSLPPQGASKFTTAAGVIHRQVIHLHHRREGKKHTRHHPKPLNRQQNIANSLIRSKEKATSRPFYRANVRKKTLAKQIADKITPRER